VRGQSGSAFIGSAHYQRALQERDGLGWFFFGDLAFAQAAKRVRALRMHWIQLLVDPKGALKRYLGLRVSPEHPQRLALIGEGRRELNALWVAMLDQDAQRTVRRLEGCLGFARAQ